MGSRDPYGCLLPMTSGGSELVKQIPTFLGVNLPETTADPVISHITAHQVSAEENCSVYDYLQ